MFIGDDPLKREAMLERISDRVGKLGDITLNKTTFSAPEVESPEAVLAACTTLPFLSERRLVVVKEVESADKILLDALARYVGSPAETTTLVLSGEKLGKSTKLYRNAVAAYPKSYVACDQKTRRGDVEEYIRKVAASMRISMDQAAVSRLRQLVGNSTVALDSEVRKLAGYVVSQQRTCITVEDVDAMVSRREQPKPWDLTDPLSCRDVKRCLSVLSRMEDRDKPLGLMAQCVKRMRELLVVKSLDARPGPMPSLSRQFGGRSDYAYRNHLEYSRNFTEEELIDILDKAADYEEMMKSGYDSGLCFEMWIIGTCTGNWASRQVPS